MKRLALFLITACLSVMAMAAEVIKPERMEVFGDITVHYNTYNSTFLKPETAKAAGLSRDSKEGVIIISALRAGKSLEAEVSGSIKDLIGNSIPLTFKKVDEPNALYYVAQYPVQQQEVRTFEVAVKTGDKINTLNFNQELFPGQ